MAGDHDADVSRWQAREDSNPHVRFDERSVKTEAWRSFQGTDRRKGRQPIGQAYTTASHLGLQITLQAPNCPILHRRVGLQQVCCGATKYLQTKHT